MTSLNQANTPVNQKMASNPDAKSFALDAAKFVAGTGRKKATHRKIMVIDRFSGPENFIDINGDRIPEISHGDVIVKILEKFVDPSAIFRIDIIGPSYLEALSDAALYIKNTPDTEWVVNFSQQTFGTTLAGLREVTGIAELTPENLREHKQNIRAALNNLFKRYMTQSGALTVLEQTYVANWGSVMRLDEMADAGAVIYVAAGNEGADQVNLFSLAKGTITIGSSDLENTAKPAAYCPAHTLVDRLDKGFFPIREIRNAYGVSGFNFTGGNTPDIAYEMVYNSTIQQELKRYRLAETYQSPPDDYGLWGTSFAVPWWIGENCRWAVKTV